MRDIYVISDTHFGHENILKFVDTEEKPLREFHDIHHMHEHMIDLWNKTVKDNDIVCHPPIKSDLRAFHKSDEYRPAYSYFERNRNIVDSCEVLMVVPYQT